MQTSGVVATIMRDRVPESRNVHGHLVINIVGEDLTGAQELAHLEAVGVALNEYARPCLLDPAYDEHHRQQPRRVASVALVRGGVIRQDDERITTNLQVYGRQLCGYGKPLASMVFRVRETLSPQDMDQLKIRRVAALHDPLRDCNGGNPGILYYDKLGVSVCWDRSLHEWEEDTFFIFPTSP